MGEIQNLLPAIDFKTSCSEEAYFTTNFSQIYRLERYPRPVAIKRMQLHGSIFKDERVIREHGMHAMLQKEPNRSTYIVDTLQSEILDDYAYIAFSWEPATLASFQRRSYSPKTYRRILFQLATGLQYLHDKGIIHRDVKPSNVLLTSADLSVAQVRLADFGFARILDKQEEDMSLTKGIGTPAYAAPEIIGRSTDYTSKVDVWSYGAVAYELMTGAKPFQARTIGELDQRHRTGPSYQREFAGGDREECESFLKLCLNIDANRRPAMSEVLQLPFFAAQRHNLPQVRA